MHAIPRSTAGFLTVLVPNDLGRGVCHISTNPSAGISECLPDLGSGHQGGSAQDLDICLPWFGAFWELLSQRSGEAAQGACQTIDHPPSSLGHTPRDPAGGGSGFGHLLGNLDRLRGQQFRALGSSARSMDAPTEGLTSGQDGSCDNPTSGFHIVRHPGSLLACTPLHPVSMPEQLLHKGLKAILRTEAKCADTAAVIDINKS
mmetsp:Transcript_6066/g.13748  ORF Transcript_6066/g.13748 Transcript_6066/m.13748 type:complete len:203 (-) Transcript_6066:129-737(-)